jgi:hypothetical protein
MPDLHAAQLLSLIIRTCNGLVQRHAESRPQSHHAAHQQLRKACHLSVGHAGGWVNRDPDQLDNLR